MNLPTSFCEGQELFCKDGAVEEFIVDNVADLGRASEEGKVAGWRECSARYSTDVKLDGRVRNMVVNRSLLHSDL